MASTVALIWYLVIAGPQGGMVVLPSTFDKREQCTAAITAYQKRPTPAGWWCSACRAPHFLLTPGRLSEPARPLAMSADRLEREAEQPRSARTAATQLSAPTTPIFARIDEVPCPQVTFGNAGFALFGKVSRRSFVDHRQSVFHQVASEIDAPTT